MPPSQSDPQSTLSLVAVRLERFKAAFKPDPIRLGGFNVVIGRNGTGKSTLLEALQWLDGTIRQDARAASERYHGVHDLINLRSRTQIPYFCIDISWREPVAETSVSYTLKVRESEDGATPAVMSERLSVKKDGGDPVDVVRSVDDRGRRVVSFDDPGAGERGGGLVWFTEPDRLALARVGASVSDADNQASSPAGFLGRLQDFWDRAVFLRLSPNRLSRGSHARRRSFEPLLDEEGQNLPALLNELDQDQTKDLIAAIRRILPDIRGVEVSQPTMGRDERVFYSLKERMPYRGRTGRYQLAVPAWMLSEGTRRITAILALLQRDPPPSLLCIEEIENGLDPWTVIAVLEQLQSAAERGVQVIVTTHSPWLLDSVRVQDILEVTRSEGETRYARFADREAVKRYQGRVPPGSIYVMEGNRE
ncbi:MAG: AAA family ATPase [Gemmatimonadetes bacterium]|nr:AAA family ATPase [Gemmatimonadota bacterium]